MAEIKKMEKLEKIPFYILCKKLDKLQKIINKTKKIKYLQSFHLYYLNFGKAKVWKPLNKKFSGSLYPLMRLIIPSVNLIFINLFTI